MRSLVLVAVFLVFCCCTSDTALVNDNLGRCNAPKYADGPQCRAYIIRYTYNSHLKKCKKFIYGGCNPSRNNFETLEECKKICGGF